MKKILLLTAVLSVFVTSLSFSNASSALEKARRDYYDSESTVNTYGTYNEDDVYVDENYDSKLAEVENQMAHMNERLDFYQRVVRSVEREEEELKELKKITAKPKVTKTTKTIKK